MELSKSDLICGQPASAVRQILRCFSAGPDVSAHSNYFHTIGLSIADTHALILDLLAEGYLTQDTPHPFFRSRQLMDFPDGLTASTKGRRIAVTRFGKRMNRKTIEKLLKTVIDRAKQTSLLPVFAYEVCKIYVFGSYLDDSLDSYGDLDLVCVQREKDTFLGSHPTKYTASQLMDMFLSTTEEQNIVIEQINGRMEEWHRLKREGVLNCSPPKPDMYGFALWDLKTVDHLIKSRNYRISLHSMAEFERLNTNEISLVYDIDQGRAPV